MDCIFCKIAKGEIPSAKVFENDKIIAFLDINPVANGHCLIIPKQHFEDIFDIDENTLLEIAKATKELAQKIKNNLGAGGVNIINNSGKSAGQGVFHFHMHIAPRYENDGLNITENLVLKAKKADFEELKKLAEKINGISN